MKHQIGFVSGSRSDYGLLAPLIRSCAEKQEVFSTIVYLTGEHLSERFTNPKKIAGCVYREIPSLVMGNDSLATAESISKGLLGFSQVFGSDRPVCLIILGDRYESYAAAIAALIHRIPIAHIHGGELTHGAFDDAIRHSISKMSAKHFASEQEYQKRLIRMGENPESVHVVGSLGLENLRHCTVMSREEVESNLGIYFREVVLLVTYHPETLRLDYGLGMLENLLTALDGFPSCTIIFTGANSDPGSVAINKSVKKFCNNRANAIFVQSLGEELYVNVLRYSDVVLGNSSSGMTEAPGLSKPVINIGDRQAGRIRKEGVFDTKGDVASLKKLIQQCINRGLISDPDDSHYSSESLKTSELIIAKLLGWIESGCPRFDFYDDVCGKK